MCSALTPYRGHDKSTIVLIGDVYRTKTKCSGKLCLHKIFFPFLGRSNYQGQQCEPACQLRNIRFEDQTNSFFLPFGQGVYIFEESPKSIRVIIGDVYCPGKFCFNREKWEALDGYVTNNSETHLWLWKVWRLVVCSQKSFYNKRARTDDKNRQNKPFLW